MILPMVADESIVPDAHTHVTLRELFGAYSGVQLYKNNARALLLRILSIVN